jgi:hypothetical protein
VKSLLVIAPVYYIFPVLESFLFPAGPNTQEPAGEAEEARYYWEETLKADPRFEPAASFCPPAELKVETADPEV